ncbi:hypothetical protein V6N13_057087 [Hibiscus sabdariffa]
MGESIYVLRYFHGGKFRTTPKFEYVNGLIKKFQGSYDLGPDIEALEAADEELMTTTEDFYDTVLESAIDGRLKEIFDGFDHACDGGPKGDVDGPTEDADGFVV